MTAVLIGMVKDEADVIEGWVRHHADEVDHLIIADNLSTDGTRGILAALEAEGLPLTVVDDPDPAYEQSRKMSALAALAADTFGDRDLFILPADADELWHSRAERIRVVLHRKLPWNILRVPITNHLCTALDLPGGDPFRTMVWRQAEPQKLGKVAFRYQPGAVIWQGNHGVDLPEPGPLGMLIDPLLELRHFPVRSPEHMVRKAKNGKAAYDAARSANPDMPTDWGQHWSQWGALLEAGGEAAIHDAFRSGWWYLLPYLAGLIEDAAPYQRWQPADGVEEAGDGSP